MCLEYNVDTCVCYRVYEEVAGQKLLINNKLLMIMIPHYYIQFKRIRGSFNTFTLADAMDRCGLERPMYLRIHITYTSLS